MIHISLLHGSRTLSDHSGKRSWRHVFIRRKRCIVRNLLLLWFLWWCITVACFFPVHFHRGSHFQLFWLFSLMFPSVFLSHLLITESSRYIHIRYFLLIFCYVSWKSPCHFPSLLPHFQLVRSKSLNQRAVFIWLFLPRCCSLLSQAVYYAVLCFSSFQLFVWHRSKKFPHSLLWFCHLWAYCCLSPNAAFDGSHACC